MEDRRAKRPATAVTPPQADQIQATTMMVQDYLASNELLVNTTAPNQVAPFANPNKNGAIEAVVITGALGNANQLCYLASSPGSATGWTLLPITDGSGNNSYANQVIAFQTTWGMVNAVYVGTNGSLVYMWLLGDGSGWSAQVPWSPTNVTQLGVSFSPGATSSSGVTCVYCIDGGGTLWTYYRSSTGGSYASGSIPSLLRGIGFNTFSFTMFDQQNWQIQIMGGDKRYWIAGGQLTFPGAKLTWGPSEPLNGPIISLAIGQLPSEYYGGKPAGIDLFLQTDGALAWTCGAADFQPTSLAGTSFAKAAIVQVQSSNLFQVFALDPQNNLWIVPQQSEDFGSGSQPFGPPMITASNLVQFYPVALPGSTPTFMAVDATLGAVCFYYQDPDTGFWASGPVTLPTTNQYVVPRWRTEVVLYRGGQALPNTELTVSAESAVALSVGSECFFVDSVTDAVLETDIMGKATFAVLATSTSTPALTFSSPGLPVQPPYSPSGAVNGYFAGTQAGLPGWGAGVQDPFSASVLLGAQVNGQPLVPTIQGSNPPITPQQAATIITQTAQLGEVAAGRQLLRAGGPAGYMVSKIGGQFVYREFATTEEARAEAERLRKAHASDSLSSLRDWLGDVWQGIKDTVSDVVSFVVTLADKTIDLLVDVGNNLRKAFNWVVNSIEDATMAITAAFNYLETKIEALVEWVMAVFDFGAIWNTKKAFSQIFSQFPTWAAQQLQAAGSYLENGFFASLKSQIQAAFQSASGSFGSGSFSAQPDWQPMGVPLSASAPVNGQATPNDYANNPNANWFSNQYASYGPAGVPTMSNGPWDAFAGALGQASTDFTNAMSALAGVIQKLMNVDQPSSFQDISVSQFLNQVLGSLAATGVDLMDAIVQGFLAFGQAAAGALGTFLTTPMPGGFVATIYGWLAKLGGEQDPAPPTIADFLALFAAFPSTIVYKLINGADSQPFSSGTLPAVAPGAKLDLSSQQICLLMSSIVGAINLLPALWADLASAVPEPPETIWPGAIGMGITVISLVLGWEPIYAGFNAIEWASTIVALLAAAQFALILWSGGAITALMAWKESHLPLVDKLISIGSTLFGLLLLIGKLVWNAANGAPLVRYLYSVISSIPMSTSFLQLNAVQVALGGPEIVVPIKMVLDVTGYVGGYGVLGSYLAIQDIAAPERPSQPILPKPALA